MAINRLSTAVPVIAAFNSQSGTTYTFVLADANLIVQGSSSSATTYTIPLNSTAAFPVGATITILQAGTGQITLVGAGGVTVNATPGLKLRTQWSIATITKRATDTWVMYGDVMA
jgi:hypothetical protein